MTTRLTKPTILTMVLAAAFAVPVLSAFGQAQRGPMSWDGGPPRPSGGCACCEHSAQRRQSRREGRGPHFAQGGQRPQMDASGGMPSMPHGPPPPPPVIRVLDRDRDGRLSAEEIAGASQALLELDRNEDGELGHEEMHPFPPPMGRGPGGPGASHGDRPPPPQR